MPGAAKSTTTKACHGETVGTPDGQHLIPEHHYFLDYWACKPVQQLTVAVGWNTNKTKMSGYSACASNHKTKQVVGSIFYDNRHSEMV